MKEYQAPEITLLRFTAEEVLTASAGNNETQIIPRSRAAGLFRVNLDL